jgi:hypothetical protein
MVEFTETAIRHYCRNPRCRSKLPTPVSNPREAFCARGCHASFHLHRCLVCEGPLERRRADQKVCAKAKCRSALRAQSDFGRYAASSAAKLASKTADFIGSKVAPKSDRGLPWSVVAAGVPITANQYHCAIVGADLATAEADRINAAHWRKAGERGYRRPDSHAAIPGPVPVAVAPTTAAVIPDDLSIPTAAEGDEPSRRLSVLLATLSDLSRPAALANAG